MEGRAQQRFQVILMIRIAWWNALSPIILSTMDQSIQLDLTNWKSRVYHHLSGYDGTLYADFVLFSLAHMWIGTLLFRLVWYQRQWKYPTQIDPLFPNNPWRITLHIAHIHAIIHTHDCVRTSVFVCLLNILTWLEWFYKSSGGDLIDNSTYLYGNSLIDYTRNGSQCTYLFNQNIWRSMDQVTQDRRHQKLYIALSVVAISE